MHALPSPPALPAASVAVWSCLACTFENEKWEAPVCEVCGTLSADSIHAALQSQHNGPAHEQQAGDGWVKHNSRAKGAR